MEIPREGRPLDFSGVRDVIFFLGVKKHIQKTLRQNNTAKGKSSVLKQFPEKYFNIHLHQTVHGPFWQMPSRRVPEAVLNDTISLTPRKINGSNLRIDPCKKQIIFQTIIVQVPAVNLPRGRRLIFKAHKMALDASFFWGNRKQEGSWPAETFHPKPPKRLVTFQHFTYLQGSRPMMKGRTCLVVSSRQSW